MTHHEPDTPRPGRTARLIAWLSAMARREPILAGTAMFFAGIVSWGAFNTAMEATNTLPFCISCHEMRQTVYEEYRHTVHFSNASGVQAGCPDCHVPREWVPKLIRKVQASKEVYHWLMGSISTPEKFEAKRPELAAHVWAAMKANDSHECRNCHTLAAMSTREQGRFAARAHTEAPARGDTCIDCHKGISHRLPKTVATATESDEKIDLELAEEINMTCVPCHGRQGQGTGDGIYPRLAGLDKTYLARQIGHFKSRARTNIPMMPYATDRELPDEDVRTITTYLAAIELQTRLAKADDNETVDALARLKDAKAILNIPLYPGDVPRGQVLFEKECAACHGRDGYGDKIRTIPQLAGQHSLYLKRQIDDFRKAARPHDQPADAEIFKAFSDAEIGDLLAYVSTLDDG